MYRGSKQCHFSALPTAAAVLSRVSKSGFHPLEGETFRSRFSPTQKLQLQKSLFEELLMLVGAESQSHPGVDWIAKLHTSQS